MARLGNFILATALGLGCCSLASAQDTTEPSQAVTSGAEGLSFNVQASRSERMLSHKVFARMSAGIISNVGTVTGSSFSYGGANFGAVFFITERLAAGVSYKVETNFSSVPLKGFDLFGRYYFLGSGTVVTTRDAFGNLSVRQRGWSPYLGAEYSSRDFYVEGDPTAVNAEDRAVSGSLSSVNVSLGVDYRLSRRWEFTVEGNMTLLPFAGSDPRVKIKWMLACFGVNYVF